MRISAIKHAAISDSYKKFSEDICGHSGDRFWIMDGATGLSKQQSFHQESDAYWLVQLYQDYFENNETGEQALQDYIRDAITSVTAHAAKIRPLDTIPAYSLPTSALFFCDFKQNRFRYLQLGDCKCLISSHHETRLLGESKLEKLDAEVLARVVQYQKRGVGDYQDMWNELLPLLKQNRSMANRHDGYWILGFDGRAAQRSVQGQIEVSPEDRLLLMTDGYTRLFDVFKSTTASNLLELSFDLGPARMIERLRTLETGDPECLMYPRIKCHDDASALLIDIVA
jgi:hypothetical protein